MGRRWSCMSDRDARFIFRGYRCYTTCSERHQGGCNGGAEVINSAVRYVRTSTDSGLSPQRSAPGYGDHCVCGWVNYTWDCTTVSSKVWERERGQKVHRLYAESCRRILRYWRHEFTRRQSASGGKLMSAGWARREFLLQRSEEMLKSRHSYGANNCFTLTGAPSLKTEE